MRASFPFPSLAVSRSRDVAHFNAVANDPDVRPLLGGEGPIDLTSVLPDPAHFAFKTRHGGFVLCTLGHGRYDVHSMFRPAGRGAEAMDAMRSTALYMFTRTDCVEGRTTVPVENLAARSLARAAGFDLLFAMLAPWTSTERKQATFWSLSIERWALTAPETLAAGTWFHEQLESAKRLHGANVGLHADDPVHNRMVGAAVLMCRSGQAKKAVRFYNAFAAQTRYQPVTLMGDPESGPTLLDTGDAIIEVTPEGMEILECR